MRPLPVKSADDHADIADGNPTCSPRRRPGGLIFRYDKPSASTPPHTGNQPEGLMPLPPVRPKLADAGASNPVKEPVWAI